MVTSQDLRPILTALESIGVHGSKDIGTMKNIFDYLVMLIQKADEPEQLPSDESESENDEG